MKTQKSSTSITIGVIANNIGYDALQSEFRDSREELDELVELMVDVLTADPDSTTYIAGQEMRDKRCPVSLPQAPTSPSGAGTAES